MARCPRFRCGEETCPAHRWQTVQSAPDDLDAARTAYDQHYAQEHPEHDGETRPEVNDDGLLAA